MAHVQVREELSSSQSEAESDSESVLSDEEQNDEEEKHGDKAPSGGLADVMAAILNKSVAKKGNTILAKGQTDKEIQVRKRKRDKAEGKLKDTDSESEPERKQEKLNKKKAWNNMNRVKPNPLERERERRLQRIATRGVVQLFNAVRQQQKTLEDKLSEAGSSIKKSEKALESMNKGKFLDLLTGSKPTTQSDKKGKADQNPTSDDTRWRILRDDFMMGAKMKDWDKEEGSEGEEEESGGEQSDISDSE